MLGQAADIVVRLDRGGRAAGGRHALDHVGIERALGEEIDLAELLGLRIEHVDEQLADHLALHLGVGDAGERVEEARGCVDRDQRDVVMAAKELDNLPRLALAQQPVIDEDAGELVADRLMDEERGDGRIDPAREPANHLPIAYLRADAGDRAVAEMGHGPVAGATGDGADEIGEERGTIRRVHHFGVELDAIETPRIVGDRRERRAGRDADGAEARREPRHAVAMAHPHRGPLAHLEHALEQRRVVDDLKFGAAELACVAAFDLAAQGSHHGLLAIADAEHRHAGIEDGLRHLRRARLGHAGRPAREDDGLGQDRAERVFGLVAGHDLRVDAGLAHPPGDELRHLAAEIDDQHAVLRRVGRRFWRLVRAILRPVLNFARHGRWL